LQVIDFNYLRLYLITATQCNETIAVVIVMDIVSSK